jgi:hypothetical protein
MLKLQLKVGKKKVVSKKAGWQASKVDSERSLKTDKYAKKRKKLAGRQSAFGHGSERQVQVASRYRDAAQTLTLTRCVLVRTVCICQVMLEHRTHLVIMLGIHLRDRASREGIGSGELPADPDAATPVRSNPDKLNG